MSRALSSFPSSAPTITRPAAPAPSKGVEARNGTLVIRLTRPIAGPAHAALVELEYCAVPPNTPLEEPAESASPRPAPTTSPRTTRSKASCCAAIRTTGVSGRSGWRRSGSTSASPSSAASRRSRPGAPTMSHSDRAKGQPPVSARVLERLEASYGPESEAAQAGHQRLFTQDLAALDAFVFNTQSGPFADPRLRRAVNYAIDRPALSKDTAYGHVGRPADQFIPPVIPGFEDAAIYPLDGPDVAAARRLAGDERHHAVLYTCGGTGCIRDAQILQSNLEAIGIDLEVRRFASTEAYFRTISERPPAWDIALLRLDPRLLRSLRLHQLPVRARRGRGAQQLPRFRHVAADGGRRPPDRRGAAACLRPARPRPRSRGARRTVCLQHQNPLPLRPHGLPGVDSRSTASTSRRSASRTRRRTSES